MCQCKGQSSCCSSSGCGCSCQQKSAGACGCCGHKEGSCGAKNADGSWGEKFLALADQAWMEVLKEKIKENIKANGKHMDELARLISETNHDRWKKKMDAKNCCSCFEDKLKGFFEQSCKTK